MKARKQSSTSYPILFLMVDSTDHVTGKTGLSPTVTISKNGGAFASPSGAITELSSGWYAIAGNATDRNTVGELLIHATGTGADTLDERYLVVPFDPFDANALGMAYLTGDAYARLGAPAGASVSADIAALPTAAENAAANWDEARAGHVAAGSFGEGVKVDSIADAAITADSIDYGAIQDDKIHGATYTEMGAKAAQLTWQSLSADYAPAGGFYVADSMGEQMTHLDADVSSAGGGLDAAGVRTAVGLASANLDMQIGATKAVVDLNSAYIGIPDITLSDDIAAAKADTAAIKTKTDNLPAAPASTTNITAASGIAVSSIGANVIGSSQLAASGVDEIAAAVALLTDPQIDVVTAILGLPAGGSMSADIAAVKAETATINANTTAAAQRSAVGLATANLDTQLGAIDDLVDTEVAAIKAKTDLIPASPAAVGSAMTLAAGAIDDTKIADLALKGKHFDTDVEVAAVTGAVGSVTAGVTVTTNNDKTGYTLTSGERNSVADALLDRADAIATGITLREAVEVAVAALAGKLSGAGTATITIRDIADTKNVIVATVSAGNRTAVTITP